MHEVNQSLLAFNLGTRMQVLEAVASRRSIRAFLPAPVPGDVIRRVIEAAARSPSGGNLQPWHIDVLAGEPLAELKATMRRRLGAATAANAEAPEAEVPAYDVYPKSLPSPWRDRRFGIGEAMYARLGIPREGFAFSNNPRIWFGPPSFTAARFTLPASGTAMNVRMNYMF